ncbi:MAG: class I SAM-dependent methyltransferase [Pikeienuella sp.]
MTQTHALHYTDDLIAKYQLRWGKGFMSPGGSVELERMLRGINLKGLRGLDVGCGMGGYDALMVTQHGADHVTGVDIDGATLGKARQLSDQQDLNDKLSFLQIGDGRLPFEDESFDFAICKNAIDDMPDKAAAFAELHRVLKPSGKLIISDLFCNDRRFHDIDDGWIEGEDEVFGLETLFSASTFIEMAGFSDLNTDDRTTWFRDYARDEYCRLKGALFTTYVKRFGVEQARSSVETARTRWLLAEQGRLRPGHIRASKH